jgi:hypothetical protein
LGLGNVIDRGVGLVLVVRRPDWLIVSMCPRA